MFLKKKKGYIEETILSLPKVSQQKQLAVKMIEMLGNS